MDADIIAVDAAAGEAEDLRLDAGGLVDLAEHLVEVLQIRFDRGVYFLVVVRIAVDSKRVARRDDLLHPLEIALLICADHDEGSLDAVLVKDLQNFIRPRRGTVVKGQVDGVVHVHGAAQRIVGVQLGV